MQRLFDAQILKLIFNNWIKYDGATLAVLGTCLLQRPGEINYLYLSFTRFIVELTMSVDKDKYPASFH